MIYIPNMIAKANGASDASAELRVACAPNTGVWRAAIVDGDDGEVITLESDWDTKLEVFDASMEAAIASLDLLCAIDFI